MYEESCSVADLLTIISFSDCFQDVDLIREKFVRRLEKLDKLSDSNELSDKVKEKIYITKEKFNNYIFLLEKIENNIVNYIAELEKPPKN